MVLMFIAILGYAISLGMFKLTNLGDGLFYDLDTYGKGIAWLFFTIKLALSFAVVCVICIPIYCLIR